MAAGNLIAIAMLLGSIGAIGTDLQAKSAGQRHKKALGGGASSVHSRKAHIKKQPEIEQNLIICNAYASQKNLDVFHVRTLDRITASEPLRYKDCREFNLLLGEGDQLDFKADNLDVGTFYATGLPRASSSLLLIPHRRDARSVAISFESHAFADMQAPQIAVVDAYKGKDQAAVKIMEDLNAQGAGEKPIEEMLKFSSVVAVNAGSYKVALTQDASTTNTTGSNMPLLVENQAKYVVMRVGIEPTSSSAKQQYPEELVIFPNAAFGSGLCLVSLMMSALAVFSHLL